MAVRIIIERRIKEGKEVELGKLLLELRSRAIKQKGYITGETLRDYDDPSTHIVIRNRGSADRALQDENLRAHRGKNRLDSLP